MTREQPLSIVWRFSASTVAASKSGMQYECEDASQWRDAQPGERVDGYRRGDNIVWRR